MSPGRRLGFVAAGALAGACAQPVPVRNATIAPFAIDVTETSVDEYAECVAAGACGPSGFGAECNSGHANRGLHPVNCVDWSQASAYCAWAGKRLPTEGEWEYAAGGAEARAYPWGNEEPGERACWNAQSSCTVGSHPGGRSSAGLDDMAGNVWEWTATGHGGNQVIRGGSWMSSSSSQLRLSSRQESAPAARTSSLGFRCAK